MHFIFRLDNQAVVKSGDNFHFEACSRN